jgi:ribosomal protein S18 acetylase RimI-like enzyme
MADRNGVRFTVRPADEEDAAAIVTIARQVFVASFGHSIPALDLETYLDATFTISAISREIADPLKDILVAIDVQDEVVGFIQLTQGTYEPCVQDPATAVELQRIYISQDNQSMGVGRILYERLVELAKSKGFRSLWLGVWEENINAQRAYQKFGFSKIGQHEFKIGECTQMDWIMMTDI